MGSRSWMFETLMSVAIALAGCADPTPQAVPSDPETEPSPRVAQPPESEAEAVRTALLGEWDGEAGADDSEPASPPAEVKPQKKARRVRSQPDAAPRPDSKAELASPLPLPAEKPVLADSAFEDVVGSWRGVDACLATERPRTRKASGALKLALTIDGSGAVVEAEVVERSGALDQALAACVERKAARLHFPAFGGSEPAEKVAKFVF
ncbi:MAG: hypothetical protein ACFB9M_10315 [Myxococcota bacterium]